MQFTDKKLLLINPWIYDFAAFDLWSKPLGLLYIAAFLRDQGFQISFIDCVDAKIKAKRYGVGHLNRSVIKKPEVINHIPRNFARYGISEEEFQEKLNHVPVPAAILVTSIMTYWYPGVQRAVEMIRERFPGVPIILGGIYATLMPEHAMRVVRPDHIVTGPGEIEALKLLYRIFDLDENQITIGHDLDSYPYPAFDLYEKLDYLVILTARGCPYDCTFCAQKKISLPFVQRSPEKVVAEIIWHYQKYKIRDFAFYDDALFINRDRHIRVILENLIAAQIPVRLHSPNGLFARYINRGLAELMYQANFKTVRISFETSNEKRHKDMSNKISNEAMTTAVENLIQAGYKSHELDAYIIMGLPGQSIEEVLASMIFVNNLGVQIRLASYSPIPGTTDFDRAVESGHITPDIDPLLTNKSIFPLHTNSEQYDSFQKVRIFSQLLNEAVCKGLRPFADAQLGLAIKNVLKEL